MEELIKQAFLHVDVIGPHVHQGHYDLIGPDGEIILPQVWETMVQPDWSITMHMWPMPEPPPEPAPMRPEDMLPPPPPDGAYFMAHNLPMNKKKTKDKVKVKRGDSLGHANMVHVPPMPQMPAGGGGHPAPPPPPPPPHAHGHGHPVAIPPPPAVEVITPGSSKPKKKKPPPSFSWFAGAPKKKSK